MVSGRLEIGMDPAGGGVVHQAKTNAGNSQVEPLSLSQKLDNNPGGAIAAPGESTINYGV